MADTARHDSIEALGRDAWNACFPGELEDYDYFVAIERAHIEGFAHSYYTLSENGRLLAAIPAFFTQYDLSTTAQGRLQNILARMKRACPALLTLKLACLGSPETESCPVGMHPSLDDGRRRDYFRQLLAFFEEDAKRRTIKLTGIKDLSAADAARYAPELAKRWGSTKSLPTALLPIDFSTIDAYLTRLSPATRKDMRRKLRRQSDIRVEYRSCIDDVLPEVMAMYLETKSRSDWQFEELTPGYFQEVLKQMKARAFCALYFAGAQLVAANLMLVNQERLLDKFFMMRAEAGQAHNLYFVSWFSNLQYCIDHGLKTYQSGQGGYEAKLRLKSRLRENSIYFRHQNPGIQMLLRLLAPSLGFTLPEKQDAA